MSALLKTIALMRQLEEQLQEHLHTSPPTEDEVQQLFALDQLQQRSRLACPSTATTDSKLANGALARRSAYARAPLASGFAEPSPTYRLPRRPRTPLFSCCVHLALPAVGPAVLQPPPLAHAPAVDAALSRYPPKALLPCARFRTYPSLASRLARGQLGLTVFPCASSGCFAGIRSLTSSYPRSPRVEPRHRSAVSIFHHLVEQTEMAEALGESGELSSFVKTWTSTPASSSPENSRGSGLGADFEKRVYLD
uniref:Uncharacterized protein n=1 Tax=Mycena chlorophos TaxID=658473 RepID=A0ABQ0KU93_MYCCL|nr:predicted protein [Mycena chlorophos]